jgi:hypothetical protein
LNTFLSQKWKKTNLFVVASMPDHSRLSSTIEEAQRDSIEGRKTQAAAFAAMKNELLGNGEAIKDQVDMVEAILEGGANEDARGLKATRRRGRPCSGTPDPLPPTHCSCFPSHLLHRLLLARSYENRFEIMKKTLADHATGTVGIQSD